MGLAFLLEFEMAHWILWMEWRGKHVLVLGRVSYCASGKGNQIYSVLENEKAYWTLSMEWKVSKVLESSRVFGLALETCGRLAFLSDSLEHSMG